MLPSFMTSSNPISPKTLCHLSLYLMMIYMKFDHIWPTDIRDILLLKCEWTTNGQTDGLGMPNYCPANTAGELKRKLRRQGEPNPPIFLCLKQSRSYLNDLTYI